MLPVDLGIRGERRGLLGEHPALALVYQNNLATNSIPGIYSRVTYLDGGLRGKILTRATESDT
jgi:hypothetical protein